MGCCIASESRRNFKMVECESKNRQDGCNQSSNNILSSFTPVQAETSPRATYNDNITDNNIENGNHDHRVESKKKNDPTTIVNFVAPREGKSFNIIVNSNDKYEIEQQSKPITLQNNNDVIPETQNNKSQNQLQLYEIDANNSNINDHHDDNFRSAASSVNLGTAAAAAACKSQINNNLDDTENNNYLVHANSNSNINRETSFGGTKCTTETGTDAAIVGCATANHMLRDSQLQQQHNQSNSKKGASIIENDASSQNKASSNLLHHRRFSSAPQIDFSRSQCGQSSQVKTEVKLHIANDCDVDDKIVGPADSNNNNNSVVSGERIGNIASTAMGRNKEKSIMSEINTRNNNNNHDDLLSGSSFPPNFSGVPSLKVQTPSKHRVPPRLLRPVQQQREEYNSYYSSSGMATTSDSDPKQRNSTLPQSHEQQQQQQQGGSQKMKPEFYSSSVITTVTTTTTNETNKSNKMKKPLQVPSSLLGDQTGSNNKIINHQIGLVLVSSGLSNKEGIQNKKLEGTSDDDHQNLQKQQNQQLQELLGSLQTGAKIVKVEDDDVNCHALIHFVVPELTSGDGCGVLQNSASIATSSGPQKVVQRNHHQLNLCGSDSKEKSADNVLHTDAVKSPAFSITSACVNLRIPAKNRQQQQENNNNSRTQSHHNTNSTGRTTENGTPLRNSAHRNKKNNNNNTNSNYNDDDDANNNEEDIGGFRGQQQQQRSHHYSQGNYSYDGYPHNIIGNNSNVAPGGAEIGFGVRRGPGACANSQTEIYCKTMEVPSSASSRYDYVNYNINTGMNYK